MRWVGLFPPAGGTVQGHTACQFESSQDSDPGLLAHGSMLFPLKPAITHLLSTM